MKWYAIQVTAGRETEIRDALERAGIRACAPQELRLNRRGGKWAQKLYTLFPSYVFLRAHYDADAYYKIKGIGGVLHFVGPEGRPEPLSALKRNISGSSPTPAPRSRRPSPCRRRTARSS